MDKTKYLKMKILFHINCIIVLFGFMVTLHHASKKIDKLERENSTLLKKLHSKELSEDSIARKVIFQILSEDSAKIRNNLRIAEKKQNFPQCEEIIMKECFRVVTRISGDNIKLQYH